MDSKFMQVNLNRSRMAHDLLFRTVYERGNDVIIGQEPNKKLALASGLVCDINCDCFVSVRRDLIVESVFRGVGFVVVELTDFCVLSCYFSPNGDVAKFAELLDAMSNYVHLCNKEIIIGGDLNAKTPLIGSNTVNVRGSLLEDFIASDNLIIANEGGVPTFSGPQGESHIDFTATTSVIGKRISGWRVATDEENFSDHRSIYFALKYTNPQKKKSKESKGWVISQVELEKFSKNVKLELEERDCTPDKLVEIITTNCDKYLKPKTWKNGCQPVYWWNKKISEKRKECNRLRRLYMRQKQKGLTTETLNTSYKDAKKSLKREINKSKSESWKRLCDELEENVWGKAYGIITKRMNLKNKAFPDKRTTEEQIQKLFPREPLEFWNLPEVGVENVLTLEMEELMEAVDQLKVKKAPGPDQITPEILKVCVKKAPGVFLKVFNDCFRKGWFPERWKRSRLVLIEKPRKKQNAEITYRPICLIDTAGKLLEMVIRNRLQKEISKKKLVQGNQYGFTKNKSTLDAMKAVMDVKKSIKTKALANQELCVMVLLDIKNAFNSASWKGIMEALTKGKVSEYLIKIIGSYLSERRIITAFDEERVMSCGVPQGSILGPTLWNVFYDRILRVQMESGVSLIAYADDLAILTRGKTASQVKEKAQYSVYIVVDELRKMGLLVEPKKSELLIVEGRRTLASMDLTVDGVGLSSSESVKYLGVTFDRNLRMTTHVKKTTEKALQMTNILRKIMPNMGGPGSKNRKLLRTAVISVVAYGAPIWKSALRYQKYAIMLEAVNRKLALGVAGAYRTTGTKAILAITGQPPIDLIIQERMEMYEKGKDFRNQARESIFDQWQARWNEYNGWTKTFIRNVKEWTESKFVRADYYVTQALTGHGIFATYLKNIKKLDSDNCWFCGSIDTPEHCIFQCYRFEEIRMSAAREIGTVMTKENIGDFIISSESNFKSVAEMLRKIMKFKEVEEKKRGGNP
ncbi:hypothetical protein HUJ05_002587 [Dendroctonus ponderosae]|nr:hypothetical protein HUJ05_002587 [Dendroctonus ponderosae]